MIESNLPLECANCSCKAIRNKQHEARERKFPLFSVNPIASGLSPMDPCVCVFVCLCLCVFVCLFVFALWLSWIFWVGGWVGPRCR
jgi:hypothetical protein